MASVMASVMAIRQYILQKYPTVNISRLKCQLKQALAKGISQGLFIQILNSKVKGATSSFKFISKKKRIIKLRKMSTVMVTKKPTGEVKETGPKNPGKAKKDPPKPREVENVPKKPAEVKNVAPKPDTAKEKAPKKGSEVKKVPPKPEKATEALPHAAGLSGKPAGKDSSHAPLPADAEVPRKINAGSKSSKTKVTKGKTGATFPATKNTAAKARAHNGAAAPGAGKESKTKPVPPPKTKGSSGAMTVLVHLAKKMGVSKTPLSKESIAKAKAKS